MKRITILLIAAVVSLMCFTSCDITNNIKYGIAISEHEIKTDNTIITCENNLIKNETYVLEYYNDILLEITELEIYEIEYYLN